MLNLLLLLAPLLSLPACAQNLVTNGDFSSGLSGWTRAHASAPGAIAVVEVQEAVPAAQLKSTDEWVDLTQPIAISARQPVVFQLDLRRTAAGRDICAYLIIRRENGKDEYYALGADQTVLDRREHFARVIDPPGDTASARLLLMNRLHGATAWFSNVQVVPVTSEARPAADYCPKLAVPVVQTAPVLDGTPGQEEWAAAATITGFVRIADGTPAEAGTVARLMRDTTHLYVAARCEEPFMALGSFINTGHDAGGLFADEVIEIFLDPDNDHRGYYHFAVNGAGGDYDAAHGEGPVEGSAFDSGWTVAAGRGEGFWTVEVAIPFASLATGAAGDVWGFNICRERHVPEHRENTAWSATGPRFHSPERFGDLVGLAAVARAPLAAEILGIDSLTPGPAQLGVRLTSRTQAALPTTALVRVAVPGGGVIAAEQVVRLEPGGTEELRLPLTIEHRGAYQVSVDCVDETGARLCTAPPYGFTVPPLLRAAITRPWYRGRIFSKMGLRQVEIEADVAERDVAALGWTLTARALSPGGGGLSATVPVDAAGVTVALPCTDLPDGSYELGVTLSDAAGQDLASVTGLKLEKLPPGVDEVWFDRENNLYINGEPHFPTGFYSLDWAGRMALAAEGDYTLFHTYAGSTPARLDPEVQGSWDWQTWLDAGAAAGMRAFLGFGYRGDNKSDFITRLARGQAPLEHRQMTQYIERWKTHPALLGWYIYDEPSLAGRTPEEMAYLYKMADDIDPYHPKLQCLVFWTDARFNDTFDVLMPDPYPIRAEGSRPLRSVAEAIRAARRTVGDRKPVWPVLQWYRYEGGRFPNPTELRCMAFLAVAAGAKGMTWYSFYHGYKDNAAQWPEVARVGRELRSVQDIVLAPYAHVTPRLDPPDAPLELMLKRTESRLHIVAVNYEAAPTGPVTLHLPLTIRAATERLSGASVPVQHNGLTLDLAPYEPTVIDIELEP
jgi:hypothetical protein